MALPVVTVASGGLPVVDVTASVPTRGMPITEVASRGMAVTKVGGTLGLPVTYVTADGQVVLPFTTFDPATISNVTLSNGNLTTTHSNTSAGGSRSALTKSAGKIYFEVTVIASHGAGDVLGIATSAVSYATIVAGNPGNYYAIVYRQNGAIYTNGNNSSKTISSLLAGDIVGVAVDLTASLIWFRKAPSGNWNGLAIGSENPATGVGGVALAAAQSYAPVATFGSVATQAGDAFTANFGGSAFSGAVPSGFTAGWG
jgi:SPRY domain